MAVLYYPLQQGFVVTSPFGPRWGANHWGVDFGYPGGSGGLAVYAVKSGTIVHSGSAAGFGQWVVVDHPASNGGGATVYGHVIPEVRVGDFVRAGQRIARINPDSNTNGGVAPHLHLEWHRYVWTPNTADRLDPWPRLTGAAYPGTHTPPEDTVTASPQWGIDVSNHQPGFDFARAAREGFTWATHKVTEGAGYRDPIWPRAREQMREHFHGLFGGYVFCRRASHPEAEADTLLAHLGDASIPIQLDYEDTTGGGTLDDMVARIAAIEARGMRVFSVYLPRWFWRDRMGSPTLPADLPALWNSDYGTNRAGYASAIYPGDHDLGWSPFGGRPVELLQFSERGVVAGTQPVDVNAYRGSLDQLRALFGGASTESGGDFMPALTPDEQRQLYNALCIPRPSLIEPEPGEVAPSFDMPTYQQLIDASTFRSERKLDAVIQNQNNLAKLLQAVLADRGSA